MTRQCLELQNTGSWRFLKSYCHSTDIHLCLDRLVAAFIMLRAPKECLKSLHLKSVFLLRTPLVISIFRNSTGNWWILSWQGNLYREVSIILWDLKRALQTQTSGDIPSWNGWDKKRWKNCLLFLSLTPGCSPKMFHQPRNIHIEWGSLVKIQRCARHSHFQIQVLHLL